MPGGLGVKIARVVPRPSTHTMDYWLYQEGSPGTAPRPGKWLVVIPRELVDLWWDRIRFRVAKAHLGPAAKVSTALRNPDATGPDHVIVVYTGDADDEADVMRVRYELRRLGIDWQLKYKEDGQTASCVGHDWRPRYVA
jgi:hypothetical protein